MTVTLYPASDFQTENTPVGATSNYECVDEATADSAYVKNTSQYLKTDLYGIGENSIPETAVINSVTVCCNSKGTQTQLPGTASVVIIPTINENGITALGKTWVVGGVNTLVNSVWDARTSDGQPFTKEDISGLKIGVTQASSNEGVNHPRTTQVYLIVDYSE